MRYESQKTLLPYNNLSRVIIDGNEEKKEGKSHQRAIN
jgi:hypothetical protein